MKAINAYLSFDGQCREAMSFYRQCLGLDLELNAYPDASGQPSSDPSAKIMHSQLMKGGMALLMASDTPHGPLARGNNFSVAIHCDSTEEIERAFGALSQGGEVRMPLTDAPWGARFGMLTDRFGIQWMLNCSLQPTK